MRLFIKGGVSFSPDGTSEVAFLSGSGGMTASSFIKSGGTSSQFLKADGSVDNNTYLTTSTAASTYVPYNGATSAVNLGANNLYGSASWENSSFIYSGTRFQTAGNYRLDADSTGLFNNAVGYKFYAVGAGLNAWYTPQSIVADKFIKIGGTSSQYLMADGSVSTGTSGIGGSGTTNTLPIFTASTTLGNSALSQTSTVMTLASRKLDINLPTDTSIVGTLVGTGVNVGSQWVFKNDYNTTGGFVGIAAGETSGDMVLAVGANKKLVFGLGTSGQIS